VSMQSNPMGRRARQHEMSLVGAVLLLATLIYPRTVADIPALAAYTNPDDE